MEISEELIESALGNIGSLLKKQDRHQKALLEINKMALQIVLHHKNKDFHVDTAARQIQEKVLESI